VKLLNSTKELGEWTLEKVLDILENPLSPSGIYLIIWDGVPVATACSLDRGVNNGKKAGELGWLAVDHAYRGKNLGLVVCAQVVKHLLNSNYEEIYLLTDHWRYPAIKTYLKLGFEPVRDGPDDRFLWLEISKKLGIFLAEPKRAKYLKGPTGEEIAWRTLNLEKVKEPCILATWCMKRQFFQELAHCQDIYEDAPHTVVEAFIRAGTNLCPQFIMPSPVTEHLAANPFKIEEVAKEQIAEKVLYKTPEDVRDFIETLPEPGALEKNFNIEKATIEYAGPILKLREMARGEVLFIQGFGQADFMGGYTRWGFSNYLTALALYPEHLKRYFAYSGEMGRLYNIALARAVKKYNLAPFVYSGQDICFNNGPICSLDTLDQLYFPYLVHAVEPLHKAGIKIIWHCDGDVRSILDRLINQVGVAGFQGFQEETGCTLEHVVAHKTREGKKLILWGSISVTTTLPFGTVGKVKEDVERCFRIAASEGGFGLASTSSILPETPLANILAMFEHGLNFGRKFLE